jgi:hypothetical protein
MIAGSEVATMFESFRLLTQEQRQVCGARELGHDHRRVSERENCLGWDF